MTVDLTLTPSQCIPRTHGLVGCKRALGKKTRVHRPRVRAQGADLDKNVFCTRSTALVTEPCYGREVLFLVPDSPFCIRSNTRGLLCNPDLGVFARRCLFTYPRHSQSFSHENGESQNDPFTTLRKLSRKRCYPTVTWLHSQPYEKSKSRCPHSNQPRSVNHECSGSDLRWDPVLKMPTSREHRGQPSRQIESSI